MNVAPFRPAWWCRGAHLQTLWPNRIRRRPDVALVRERFELPDGDFLDVDWTPGAGGPIVLILHGLQGSSRSIYARGLLRAMAARGWRGALMHFRGCSGEPNRLPRSYHSGDTGDLAHVVARLREREPTTSIAAIGVSLGGNVLLKWLGEIRERAPLAAAVAVSVPFLLRHAADRLQTGLSRIYQWSMLRCLRQAVKEKYRQVALPLNIERLSALRCFRDFDEHVTAPLHGFRGAEHYYEAASCRRYLASIAVPTLLIQARDDPFMHPAVIPEPHELASCVTLELYDSGGHVGFVAESWPWRPRYWLEERIPHYFASRFHS